jgi:hypothetical protein
MTSAVSLGQTNVPTNETSYIKGTFKAPAPRVVRGADAASSSFERSVTIATTIRQVVDSTYKTNTKTGIITYKDAFKNYAFGNKELLQLGLGTSNIRGYSLVATNKFGFFSISGLVFAAKKGTNFTAVGISAGWDDALYTSDTAENSNGEYLKENYAGIVRLNVGLGPFTGLSAIGSYKESLASVVFGTGTNKTTNTYYSTSANGSISQFWSPPQP